MTPDTPLRILSLKEAARMMNKAPCTMRELALARKVPGAKVGRSWTFVESDLLAHLRAQYAEPLPCLSTSKPIATFIGSLSRVPASLGYVSRLEQAIEARRKKRTTG